VAAPLVLMAVAVSVSAHAEHQRQQAIERITDLLEQLHEDNLDKERNELDGCREAIDKATSILLDQGRIGFSLGLDSSVHGINTAIAATRRRLKKWEAALDALSDGAVEVSELKKSFPGITEEGGTFRAHLEIARLAIALKRRVLVLQAVEHAQQDTAIPSRLSSGHFMTTGAAPTSWSQVSTWFCFDCLRSSEARRRFPPSRIHAGRSRPTTPSCVSPSCSGRRSTSERSPRRRCNRDRTKQ
jgi:hypothetical protein